MEKTNNLTILVNSCDKNRDLWPIFFYMLKRKWKDVPYEIVLNSEKLAFNYKGLNITNYCVNTEKEYSWSERLYLNLQKIKTDYVLFMLEDFYFENEISNEEVENLMQRVKKIKNFGCLYLMDLLTNFPCYYDKKSELFKIHKYIYIKANATCAIWNKKYLMSLLRFEEDPWQFELGASKRAFLQNKKFYCQYNYDYEKLLLYKGKVNKQKVFYCDFEKQIYRGQWTKSCVDFLTENGVKCDFKKRGIIEFKKFYGEKGYEEKREFLEKSCYKSPLIYGFIFIIKVFFRKVFGIFHKKRE